VPLALSSNAVYIWCQETESANALAVSEAEASLSVEERATGDSFRLPHDRRDYVIAHDLLRRSLSTCYGVSPAGWHFGRSAHGQPIVRAPRCDVSFSIAHTRGLVACAIAPKATVGVDAERVDPAFAVDEVAERHFTSREIAALRRRSGTARAMLFFELWTLKESFVKAVGVGLTLGLETPSFEVEDSGAIQFVPPAGIDARAWHFGVFAPSDATRVAVAACCGVGDKPRFVLSPSGIQPRLSLMTTA
jgi:4'-phosphopantetheinyl transferase